MGVYAIFGPSDPVLGAHIYSICDALDIPYFDTRIDSHTKSMPSIQHPYVHRKSLPMKTPLMINNNSIHQESTINLNPSQTMVNQAFYDVMQFLNWTTVAVLYERNEGL